MTLSDQEKKALRNKASGFNSPPQHLLNERFFASLPLTLDMGEKEKNAWQRRNDAAHGNMMNPGDSDELIRDIQ